MRRKGCLLWPNALILHEISENWRKSEISNVDRIVQMEIFRLHAVAYETMIKARGF
jgi:hypothetical protein